MPCINPVQIQSPSNRQGKYIYVACGKCAWCRQDKRMEWFLRFKLEKRDSLYCKFVTLTYSDENLPFFLDEDTGEFGYRARKEDVQKFLKRMRKNGHKFKYFLVSEYAPGTRRPHYHGLFFTNGDFTDEDVRKSWKFGVTDTQEADDAALNYVTKYILKGNDRDGNFKLQSTRPAIGNGYIKKIHAELCRKYNYDTKLFEYHLPINGKSYPLPRYYRKKFEQFYNADEYEENKRRTLLKMENDDKFAVLKKIYEDNTDVHDFKSVDDVRRFLSSIRSKYYRDNCQQFEINNKKFIDKNNNGSNS